MPPPRLIVAARNVSGGACWRTIELGNAVRLVSPRSHPAFRCQPRLKTPDDTVLPLKSLELGGKGSLCCQFSVVELVAVVKGPSFAAQVQSAVHRGRSC